MNLSNPATGHMPLKRRLRRLFVRFRTWSGLVPLMLVGVYFLIMIGIIQVADGWIAALAAVPLVFAILLTAACFAAYRRDFYA